jgi:hypothetical protein
MGPISQLLALKRIPGHLQKVTAASLLDEIPKQADPGSQHFLFFQKSVPEFGVLEC